MENARTRTSSYPKPKWWKDKDNGWLDCISTATSNYGDGNVVTGNKTFAKDYDKYGFRKLREDEKPQAGDLIQYQEGVYETDNPIPVSYYPNHAALIDGFDEDGIERVNYSDGYGNYKKHAHYPTSLPKSYYRFIGTPAERAEIAAHNAAVKKQRQEIYGNKKGEPQRIETPKQAIPTEKLDTLQFLDRIKKR